MSRRIKNNIASPIIAINFGHNAKSILLFRDEDSKELEVNSWIPVCKLAHGDKISGIVMSGDIEQLRPTVLSADEELGFNEFAYQMRTSLTTRLMSMRHPVLKLTEQRRFRPVFVRWLNKRVYKNQDGFSSFHEFNHGERKLVCHDSQSLQHA